MRFHHHDIPLCRHREPSRFPFCPGAVHEVCRKSWWRSGFQYHVRRPEKSPPIDRKPPGPYLLFGWPKARRMAKWGGFQPPPEAPHSLYRLESPQGLREADRLSLEPVFTTGERLRCAAVSIFLIFIKVIKYWRPLGRVGENPHEKEIQPSCMDTLPTMWKFNHQNSKINSRKKYGEVLRRIHLAQKPIDSLHEHEHPSYI